MKTSQALREWVTKLAEKYGLDLSTPQGILKLEMEGHGRLQIEKTGQHLVNVGHYYQRPDGDFEGKTVMLFVADTDWIPIEKAQFFGSYQTYAELAPDGENLLPVDQDGQRELVEFAEIWVGDLVAQGWLTHAQPEKPIETEPPSLETLMAWMEDDSGCEATDGCWVEPDGVCPHGCPSWLIVMGLI